MNVPPLLLAVDPGARGCGVALFRSGVLVRAEYLAYIGSKDPWPHGNTAADRWACADLVGVWWHTHTTQVYDACGGSLPSSRLLLVEEMKVYAGSLSKGDPADLLRLQAISYAVVGAFASLGWEVESVLAGTWNGQVPRDIRMARTLAWLEKQGTVRQVIRPAREPRLVHNAWSAAGIGIWRVKSAICPGLEVRR